jgi:hypothetical protein
VAVDIDEVEGARYIKDELSHYPNVIYVTGQYFLPAVDFESCGINYQTMSFEAFERVAANDVEAEQIIIFDAPSIDLISSQSAVINRLLQSGSRLGLVTDMQPGGVNSALKKQWAVPVLAHPFSHCELGRFFKRVLEGQVVVVGAESDDSALNAESEPQFKGHVLIVEDNRINQMVVGDMLSDMGLSFDVVADGEQAVTKVLDKPQYDLVFMDIQMPVMDGYEATRQLRAKGYDKLVICGLSEMP